jgi:predicted nucleotidyltransferase
MEKDHKTASDGIGTPTIRLSAQGPDVRAEMERPKDRDFIETVEGLIWCVVGYLHPPDRYTAYVKYVPSEGGKWRRGDSSYRRVIPFYHVSQVEATYDLLRQGHPEYIYRCPVRKITVSSVPVERVETYHRPRARLASLMRNGGDDELEERLVELARLLCGTSGIETGDLGVTGSLLTASHSPEFSDIDLTVYGMEASRRLKRAILETRGEIGPVRPFSEERNGEWSRSRSSRLPLTFEQLMAFAERRWNYGVYEGTYFSVHPVRTDAEITEEYGDLRYAQAGPVEGRAVIEDSSESIYLPAVYRVGEVEMKGSDGEVSEIASYEGLYCDMFRPGDTVEFRGVLEHVTGCRDFDRVVVGSAGSLPGYIRDA